MLQKIIAVSLSCGEVMLLVLGLYEAKMMWKQGQWLLAWVCTEVERFGEFNVGLLALLLDMSEKSLCKFLYTSIWTGSGMFLLLVWAAAHSIWMDEICISKWLITHPT